MRHETLRGRGKALRVTYANGERPVRPGVTQAQNADGHGAPAALRRRRRHDADASARFNHRADGIEAFDAYAMSDSAPEPRGMAGQVDLQRVAMGQPDEVPVEHVRERNLPMPGQRVGPRHHEHQPVRAEE